MRLYVGNLAYNISDDQLGDLFARFGKSESAQIVIDLGIQASLCYSFAFSYPASSRSRILVQHMLRDIRPEFPKRIR